MTGNGYVPILYYEGKKGSQGFSFLTLFVQLLFNTVTLHHHRVDHAPFCTYDLGPFIHLTGDLQVFDGGKGKQHEIGRGFILGVNRAFDNVSPGVNKDLEGCLVILPHFEQDIFGGWVIGEHRDDVCKGRHTPLIESACGGVDISHGLDACIC